MRWRQKYCELSQDPHGATYISMVNRRMDTSAPAAGEKERRLRVDHMNCSQLLELIMTKPNETSSNEAFFVVRWVTFLRTAGKHGKLMSRTCMLWCPGPRFQFLPFICGGISNLNARDSCSPGLRPPILLIGSASSLGVKSDIDHCLQGQSCRTQRSSQSRLRPQRLRRRRMRSVARISPPRFLNPQSVETIQSRLTLVPQLRTKALISWARTSDPE